MKIYAYLSIILLALTVSCTSNEKRTSGKTDSTFTDIPETAQLPNYFYKRLEGTIANKSVVMELNKVNNYNAGSYYYTDNGRSITLTIDTLIAQDSLVLREYTLGEPNTGKDPKLALKWDGKGFTGTFINKAGKSFPILLNETYPNWSYRLQPDSLTETQRAFPAKADGPRGKITAQYLVYSGKNASWVNNNLKSFFEIKNNENWSAGLKKQFANYFKDYKNDVGEMGNDTTSNLYFLNYESAKNATIKFNEKDFLVIELMSYSYTGGAHGNYASSFQNLDIANQKILRLKDVLNADTTTLNKIGETYFRKQHNLSPKDPLNKVLFDNKLSLNTNFFINNKGISFLYNPYEIASYAQGQIDIFIPYDAVKPYLNTDFKQRMGIK